MKDLVLSEYFERSYWISVQSKLKSAGILSGTGFLVYIPETRVLHLNLDRRIGLFTWETVGYELRKELSSSNCYGNFNH